MIIIYYYFKDSKNNQVKFKISLNNSVYEESVVEDYKNYIISNNTNLVYEKTESEVVNG